MSFDLYFCWLKKERLDFEAVATWAVGIENFSRKGSQLWYENPKTGVYFSFDFDPQGSETLENSPVPNEYFDSGLSFGLNLNRPSFFGYEAMPFVERLAKRFGLCIVDPQVDADEPVLMTEIDSKSLTDSWLKHNKWAILTLIKDPSFSNPLRMPTAASLYLWRYREAKEDLERACGDEIYVPHLVPVHRKGTTKVGRAVTCTQGVPIIIPEAEWVIIVRAKKRFYRPKEKHEVSVISAETFHELLRGHIKAFQWPDPPVQVISSESTEKVGRILQSIDSMLARSEFEVIGADAFIDIELPENE
jgi:hypothetical protein